MKYGILAIACAMLLAFFSAPVMSETGKAIVLANQSVDVDTLTPAQLRMIFAGRTQFWTDGTRIRVLVLSPNGQAHHQFCRELLNIYPYQLERIWQRVIYSGQGDAPTTFETEQQMLNALQHTPGAIGYILTNRTLPESVHVINVEALDE